MTVPVPCPGASVDLSSSAPRKRRRRAPASGASDDCFACSKNNTKCDRRRPYCSQCLEFGTECSGYKTQLTWGVGVASRGKLRGLSLPIARSAPAPKSPSAKHTRASTATSLPKSIGGLNGELRHDDGVKIKMERQSPLPSSYTTYDFINMVPNSPMSMQIPSMGSDWTMAMSHEYMRISQPSTPEAQPNHQQLLRHSLHRLHTPLMSHGDDLNLSSSVGSVSAYSDTEYSPVEHSFTTEDVPYLASPMPLYNSYSSQNSPVDHSFGMIDSRGPTSCPDPYYAQSDISSSLSSHPTIYEMGDNRQIVGSPAIGSRDILFDDDTHAMSTSHGSDHFMSSSHASGASWSSRHEDDYNSSANNAERNLQMISSPESLHIPLSPSISSRLSFWLNYYDKIICPITVAIDSPRNPYRLHILSLAMDCPSLQHAICALASCNLRMKRRQSSGQQQWTQPFDLEMQDRSNGSFQLVSNVRNSTTHEFSSDGPADESAMEEEYQNRSQAVALLNQQLSDPENAKHDSVLATLLMLCHYRMCESGVAQFKTQFAGVKKLLGMRASGLDTGKWGWMESLFTFFDAITATVNDREAQLRGGYLDMIASPSSPDCALDNLAGFDGKLFKIIATLGRLNLLSQRRPVLDPLRPRSSSMRPGSHNRPRLSGQALVDYYKYNSTKFDGNGFATTIDEPDTEHFSVFSGASSPVTESSGDDARPLFWAEWSTTRSLLQTWEFSPSSLAAALPIPCDQSLTRDFAYVSETFRYAALLYIERLACPTLPSSHLNFQNLVSQVLFFVEALGQGQIIGGSREGSKMEKFLLWPLFVAGSECVSELHKDIIRTRCRNLSGRSGYGNNFAGLEVLEKIWKENERDGEGAKPSGSGPFRWTPFMDGVEGEYIMV